MIKRNASKNSKTVPSTRWLAIRDIRRSRLSYFVTALFGLLFGVLAVLMLGDTQTGAPSSKPENAALDVFFIFAVSTFATNSFSRDYLYSWGDTFTKRLHFLRSLPISAGELVASRVLAMLPALIFNSLVGFVTVYFLSWSFGGRLVQQLGPGEYLAFAGIWVGYAIFFGGAWLYGEFGLHGRTFNWIVFGIVGCTLPLLFALEWLFDLRIVVRTIELVEAYGAWPTVLSLAVGMAAFALWARATVRRIECRELPY